MSFSGDLYPTAGADVVMNVTGDLVRYNSGARQRLGIGSTNQALSVVGGLPAWKTLELAESTLTTEGDILYENSTPALARLGAGTSGYFLKTQGASNPPIWAEVSTTANSYLESVYDISSTVPKKHFVEFFTTDGTIPERWNSTVSGSGSITIPSGDNNGILLNTGTTASSVASVNLNNINNFAYDNASLIFVGSISSLASNYEAYLGFQTDTTFGSGVGAGIYSVHSKANFSSWSSDGSFTFADSSVTADTNPHVFQVTLSASNVKTYIDGTLATTITTDLPNAVMQPCFEINTSGTDRNFNMTYCEAWNI